VTAIGWATTAGGVDVATNSLDGFPMAGAPCSRRRGRSRARRLFHGQLVLVAAHHDHGHHGPRHRHDDSDDGRRRHDVDGADLVSSPSASVHLGDSGSGVKQIQTALVAHGYKLAVDGQFGPQTSQAVKDFQKKNGLAQDGVVGPATWAKLQASGSTSSTTTKSSSSTTTKSGTTTTTAKKTTTTT